MAHLLRVFLFAFSPNPAESNHLYQLVAQLDFPQVDGPRWDLTGHVRKELPTNVANGRRIRIGCC